MPKKILVAEDDKVMIHLLRYKLQSEGYEVVVCNNGLTAKQTLHEQQFDAVLLDLMLPLINGFELLEIVRTELNSKVPIIVISATPLREIIEKALDLGANDFVAKPFTPVELLSKIESLTTEKKTFIKFSEGSRDDSAELAN